MRDQLISQFIDDELSLDEKIDFVDEVSESDSFKALAMELLLQEKLLRTDVTNAPAPELSFKPSRSKVRWSFFKPIFAGTLAGVLMAFTLLNLYYPRSDVAVPHRFVIYQPGAKQVELVGSFSDWRAVPLKHLGQSGYWETTVNLPPGEHRFSYIVSEGKRIADPTVAAREADDFGGENSILTVRS
jgi:hypothetical protein